VRPLCGVLVFFVCLTLTGQAQDRTVPVGNGSISGRIVTSASQPIRDATVALGLADDTEPLRWQAWWAGATDADGVYQFHNLPAGRFTVITVKDGFAGWKSVPTAASAPMAAGRQIPAIAFAPAASRSTIELAPGGHASEANLTLYRPSAISGRALGLDGSPAANIPVALYTADTTGAIVDSRGGWRTEASGAYSIDDVQPGTYYVGVLQQGRLQDIDPGALIEVTITEGVSMTNIDVPVLQDRGPSITGRITDATGRVPRITLFEYGTAGTNHRGMLSSFGSDGTFEISDRDIKPGPVTLMVRGDTDEGPAVALRTIAVADGPNDVEVVVGKPGAIRGRVSMAGGAPLTAVNARLALVRSGFQPLGESDQIIDIAPDGWFDATNLIGEYKLRVDEPAHWTVTSVRRRGIRVANDRLTVGNGATLDDIEIVVGPPARPRSAN
jgi:hypothetical protein